MASPGFLEDSPHVAAAFGYARAVESGEIDAGKYVRLACRRFLRDLVRTDFTFDFDAAERPCKFIECLPHTKGRWSRQKQLLELQPWQCFIVCNIFGFLKPNGLRRFLQAFLLIPRKNGKSPLAAAIGLYMFVADNESGAEVYCGATTEKQAWEVFKPARLMAQRSELSGMIDIRAKILLDDDAKFEPVIGDPGDGGSPSCGIVDEYHEHQSSDLFDTFQTGTVGREQALLMVITTAGNNIEGPCYTQQKDAELVLEGAANDDTLFVCIYGIDEDDDWREDSTLAKANPNLGVSVDLDKLQAIRSAAMRSPDKQATFKTKHLNVWQNAAAAFLNYEDWERCGDSNMQIPDDAECVFGIDLSSRVAFTANVAVFWNWIDGQRHWYIKPRLIVPESRVLDDGSGRFASFLALGAIETHDDEEIDYVKLRQSVKEDADKYSPQEIAFDPWRATGIEQELSDEGLTMVRLPQNYGSYTEAMDELEAAAITGRIHHPNNPCFNWMIACLTAKKSDRNKMPGRPRSGQFVDGPVAMLMGMNRAMANDSVSYGLSSDVVA